MRWFDAVWELYLEMVCAAHMAHLECLSMIEQNHFDEAEILGESRNKYYDCAITAVGMLK